MLTGTIQEWSEGSMRGTILDTQEDYWELYSHSFDPRYRSPEAGDKVTFEKDEKEKIPVAIKVRKA